MSTNKKPQEELSLTRKKGPLGYHDYCRALAFSTVALTNTFSQSTRQLLHALGPVVFFLRPFNVLKMKDCNEITQRHFADPEILSEILRRRITVEEAPRCLESTVNPIDIDVEETALVCPLPTPEDSGFFERELSDVIASTKKVWHALCSYSHLPQWLQDNEYLRDGHRPPLQNFKACIHSIFSIHTETGNIWTHILGCLFFIGILFNLMIATDMDIADKTVIGIFLLGGIICFFLSFFFHTVCCHSECVGKFFNKLDYCGICILITTSFVPWLYYGFYCSFTPKVAYLTLVIFIGALVMVMSLYDKFSDTELRPLRTVVFVVYGLSGVIPAGHYILTEGFNKFVGWPMLMGMFYLTGAAIYVCRIPERFCPGRFDIWFHSHQIFHVLVVAAASIHYHGIIEMWSHRKSIGSCVG